MNIDKSSVAAVKKVKGGNATLYQVAAVARDKGDRTVNLFFFTALAEESKQIQAMFDFYDELLPRFTELHAAIEVGLTEQLRSVFPNGQSLSIEIETISASGQEELPHQMSCGITCAAGRDWRHEAVVDVSFDLEVTSIQWDQC